MHTSVRTLFSVLLMQCIIVLSVQAQSVERMHSPVINARFDAAEHDVQKRRAYQREKYFYEQRAYPSGVIPSEGRMQALTHMRRVSQALTKRRSEHPLLAATPWELVGPAPAQYESWGYVSGRTTAIAIDPKNSSRIFLGAANGGIWRSRTKGNTWAALTDQEVSLATGSIAIDPNNTDIVYVGTGEATYSGYSYGGAGFLKSTDGGNSWREISKGIPLGAVTSRLVVSSKNSSILLAGLGPYGLYRSTNAGDEWTCILTARIDDIVFFPPNNEVVFAIGGEGGLLKSTDAGSTWVSFGTGLPKTATRMQLDVCRDNPSVMYSATYNEPDKNDKVNVYKSTDEGNSWMQIGRNIHFQGEQAWYDFYIRVSPTDANVCFVGTIEIFRTTDGGQNWTDITKGYSGGVVHVDHHDLRFDPFDPATIYAACDGGLYRSKNLGDAWENMNANIILTQLYRIACDPTNELHIIGGTQDNGLQHTTGFWLWLFAFPGDGGEVCFSPADPNIVVSEAQNGEVIRSTNGGYNWLNALNGFLAGDRASWIAPIVAHPAKAGAFYHGRVNLYVTSDGGKRWQKLTDSLFGNATIDQLAISNHQTTPTIYATHRASILRSSDGGKSFNDISSGLPDRIITSVYTHPHPDSGNVVFISCSGFGSSHLYRTSYDGSEWMNLSGDLPDIPVNDVFIHPDFPDKWFAVATDVGVFFSENGGKHWSELSIGLPNTVAIHLDYHRASKKLRVATHGRSAWECLLVPLPIEPPRNPRATPGNGRISVAWEASPTAHVTGYSIYRGEKSGSDAQIAIVGTTLSFVDNEVQNNQKYFYQIRALTPNDSSLFSGEISATPRVWQGCLGNVLSLNERGKDDYVELPQALNEFPSMTFECWAWWKRFGNRSHLFFLGNLSRYVRIAHEATINALIFEIRDSTGVHTVEVPRVLASDRPVHIAAVFGSSGMKLYLDGELAGTNPFTGSATNHLTSMNSNSLGRSIRDGDANFFGTMDEIRLWKSERSASRIKSDFNRTLSIEERSDTNLVLYYDCESVRDSVLFDASRTQHHGILKNSTRIIPCDVPVSVERMDDIPLAFELYQNHPNPIGISSGNRSQRTSILFRLHRTASVTLEVYNSHGVRVAQILKDELLNTGVYTEYFDCSALQRGVYLYVMRAGNRIASRKMAVVR